MYQTKQHCYDVWLGKWFLCFKQMWCLFGTSRPFKTKALRNCTMWGTSLLTQHHIPYDDQSSETKLWEPQTLYTAINNRIISESQVANDVDINGHGLICDNLPWGWINPRYQVTMVTVAHICGTSERNLLQDTMLASRIQRCLLDLWKLCGPLLFQHMPEKKD